MPTATLTKSAAKATRTDSRRGRYYDITHADGTTARYPSVTTILSAIAKPALVGWAAKEERTAVSEASADLYADLAAQQHAQLPRAMYLLALEQRVGTTKAHVKALAKAAEIGSAVHARIEWTLTCLLHQVPVGPAPALSPEAAQAFGDWERFAEAVSLTPRAIEQVVWSREHQYAGTMDLLADLDAHALLGVLERQGSVAPELAAWLGDRVTATAVIDWKTGKSIYAESLLQSAAYQRALMEMGHGRPDGGLIVRLPKVASDPGFEVRVVPPARQLLPTFLAARQLWEWVNQEDEAYRAKKTRVA